MKNTVVATKPVWKSVPFNRNYILDKEGGYISYLGNTTSPGGFSFFSGDDDGAGETAIVIDGSYYILNGDFRDTYENMTIPECLEFFKANQHLASSWSNTLDD